VKNSLVFDDLFEISVRTRSRHLLDGEFCICSEKKRKTDKKTIKSHLINCEFCFTRILTMRDSFFYWLLLNMMWCVYITAHALTAHCQFIFFLLFESTRIYPMLELNSIEFFCVLSFFKNYIWNLKIFWILATPLSYFHESSSAAKVVSVQSSRGMLLSFFEFNYCTEKLAVKSVF
jgi:hypothetical protein